MSFEAFPPAICLVVHADAIRSREPGVLTLDLTATSDADCVLGMINAAPETRGSGSRAMADLCRRADELGVDLPRATHQLRKHGTSPREALGAPWVLADHRELVTTEPRPCARYDSIRRAHAMTRTDA